VKVKKFGFIDTCSSIYFMDRSKCRNNLLIVIYIIQANHDAMGTFCISGYAQKLKKHNELIKIESKDENGETKNSIISPLELDLVVMSGEHDLTSGAIRLLLSNEVDMVILDSFGNPAGYILPCGKSKLIERNDMQSHLSSERAAGIAQMICMAAINNKVTLLRSIQKNAGSDIDAQIENIRKMSGQAQESKDINSLMGYEGFSSNEYYSALMKIIPPELNFNGRNKKPPMDPVNALFGYGYGILYSKIRSAIVKSGLSPYYGRASLHIQEPGSARI
jgi:CRISP-associated protein Cas1